MTSLFKSIPEGDICLPCLLCALRIVLDEPRQELGIVDFVAVYFSSKYKLVQLPEYLLLRRDTLRHACFPALRAI